MNNYRMKYQWDFLKYYFLLVFIALILSCNSSKKTQDKSAVVKNENLETIQHNIPIQNEDGIDFFAVDPNSGWTLKLDFEGDFQFKKDDGFVFSTPAVEGNRAQDSNIIRYRAVVESGEMTIQLYQQECFDSSTGLKLPYKVTVEIKRGIDKEFTDYKGCGNYNFD